ncbi:hypothetical protein SEA_TRIBUTE_230 [Streptomyces phage Tribute]|uniref:Uncharacterized protein n=4 Tax=Samistivirus peebs TaxID=2560790 RepID=A0A5Q2WLF1_9CAUD|nr:hypothetical protein FDI38_gp076 [Streptomyces phage Peebs]ASR76620.1 hypothetical protein SEA_SUSHI23_235 [Streptomyces phage Sushi23]QGH78379.1 hypothetical protein SEA_TRIBUTE_230 [Streptomyces phage Tribute]QRI46180.1 hypothetical protein SEA_CROSS_233 [Streptomyces phage Cross]WDS51987.1 hypothetical protein SEA_PEPPERWOOD_234 [Streptomyces phage Pepperwood]WNN95551.1 hypothetical protein SEA_WATERMOORE_233 [Streptomyces phage Watermoore]
MANEYSFTDHKGRRVNKGDRVKVFRAPKGQEAWIGCTATVTSIALPYKQLIQLMDLNGQPSDYTDRFVYHPHEYLEKA